MASSSSTGRKTAARKAPAKAIKAAVGNGMHRFTLHTEDKVATRAKRALAPKPTAATRGAAAAPAAAAASAQDPETAAFAYLQRALKSDDMPEFSDPQGKSGASEFLRLGTETVARARRDGVEPQGEHGRLGKQPQVRQNASALFSERAQRQLANDPRMNQCLAPLE